ncbi:MAG: hypothetical protein QGG36_00270 [Pirellulaceae bacterium]|nr:hypothetical protein [Pirellulaceae bacterium]MDP7014210.1 hypothetical protein [Pirellulaceae bacterium]
MPRFNILNRLARPDKQVFRHPRIQQLDECESHSLTLLSLSVSVSDLPMKQHLSTVILVFAIAAAA